MPTQKKVKKVWIVVQKDVGDLWRGEFFFTRGHALIAMRRECDEYPSFKKFLKVVPAILAYTPKKL